MKTYPLVSAAALLALAAGPARAQTQPFEPVGSQSEWSIDVGGGAVYGFSATGGRAEQVNFTPWGAFAWRDRIYANGLDGLGYNIVKQDRLRFGVQLRPHYSGQSTIEGLERPDLGVDIAIYSFVLRPMRPEMACRIGDWPSC